MIVLFDKDFDVEHFTPNQTNHTLGIGVLSDAVSCVVVEELNGQYELEMEYPVTGVHFKDISVEKVILVKPNDDYDVQPFRIYKITRPINGTVTVYAQHISYDTASIPIRAINAEDLTDLVSKINSASYQITHSPFVFSSEKTSGGNISYKTNVPYSLRSILVGNDDSIAKTYEGDFVFDRNTIILKDRRGLDRDFVIRYSKNMTDLEHEVSSELIYDGICPYYSSKVTETQTKITTKYKEIYLSNQAESAAANRVLNPEAGPNQYLYPREWLSYSDGGTPIPLITTFDVVNIIASEGDYTDELIRGKKIKIEGTDNEYWYETLTYVKAYIDKNAANEYGDRWLYTDEDLTQRIIPSEWNPSGLPIGTGDGQWNPDMNRDKIYRIYTPGDNLYQTYIWKYDTSVTPAVYRYVKSTSSDGVDEHAPIMPNVGTVSEEKDNTILYEGDIIYINEKRAIVNPEGTAYASDWLIEVNELVQTGKTDPRWEEVGVIDPTLDANKSLNFKVATEETLINAYSNPDKKETDADLLVDENGNTITPVNNQGYRVTSRHPKTYDQVFLIRWSDYDKKYSYITDTRYVYTNYIWDGTSYTVRDTSKDKILTADLTDKFTDTPKDNVKFQKQLYDYALEFIKENKIGQIKDSIKVSFFKLSTSPEYSKWLELDKVSLGDSVTVIYDELGVNETKKVIRTEYNVLTSTYDSIELGEKINRFTDNAVVTGDGVSALTNDRNFADIFTASNLVAKSLTADLIQAVNAEITEAQIKSLTSEEIRTELMVASQFEIDKVVADVMVSDEGAINGKLSSGELTVNGDININSGSISIVNEGDLTYVRAYINEATGVTEYGSQWLTSDIEGQNVITPGTEGYGIDTVYKVYKVHKKSDNNYYEVWTQEYYKWDTSSSSDQYRIYNPPEITTMFEVTDNGKLYAKEAEIEGDVNINSGSININFSPNMAYINPNDDVVAFGNKWLSVDEAGGNVYYPDEYAYYKVISSGEYYDKVYRWNSAQNRYYEYTDTLPDSAFNVDKFGNVTANSLNIQGGIITSATGSLNGMDTIVVNDIYSDNIESGTVTVKELKTNNINIGYAELTDGTPNNQHWVTCTKSFSIDVEDITSTKDDLYLNKVRLSIYLENYPDSSTGTAVHDTTIHINKCTVWIMFADGHEKTFRIEEIGVVTFYAGSNGKRDYILSFPYPYEIGSYEDSGGDVQYYLNAIVDFLGSGSTVSVLYTEPDLSDTTLSGIANSIRFNNVNAMSKFAYTDEYNHLINVLPRIYAGVITCNRDTTSTSHRGWYSRSLMSIVAALGYNWYLPNASDVLAITATIHNPGNSSLLRSYNVVGIWWGDDGDGDTVYVDLGSNAGFASVDVSMIITVNMNK